MENIFLKIRGIDCRVEQKDRTDIFCYGSKCGMCCGLEICECSDKFIKQEKGRRQKYDAEFF